MKVLLINPQSPYLDNDAAYPPLGLMYVAAALNQEGCEVTILDLATNRADWRTTLPNFSRWFDLIGVTCVTPNVGAVKEIIAAVPPHIKTMVGGPHATWLPERTLEETGCSFVVSGEIESIAKEIVSDIRRNQTKKIYHARIPSVDQIHKPMRNLVNLHNYNPGGEQATPVYTSRGCPFRCHFCSKVSLNTYRQFPLPQVLDEVQEVIGLGFRKIVFGDDNMALNPRRLHILMDEIASLDIQFRLNMDARHNEPDLFHEARTSGCTDISFGIESGSQQILDAMNKQTTVQKNSEAIRLTQKAGMEAKAYFMVNFPGETEQTVRETLAWAAEVKPDRWLLSAFAPLPGSMVYLHPEKFGITSMSDRWDDYYLVGKEGKFKPCFTTDYLTYEKQIELHDQMFNGLREILG
jgi:anaerobic magnesium-protoporphyrin IX monomethyl ester cyclase